MFKTQGDCAMKYYEQLVDLGCFSRKDVTELTGSADAAHSLLAAYKKRGLIESVRRDLFVAMSLETKQPVPNRFAIASHITSNACITHHSAFEFYGYANQVFFEVYVASKERFRTFAYNSVTYRKSPPCLSTGVTEKNGVRVTDIERTVVDSIRDFEKISGLEELLRCMDMTPYLDGDKLLLYLAGYNLCFLYQKTGYILEHFKEQLKLSDVFFEACKSKITKSKRYLYHGILNEQNILNQDWMLFVPKNLLAVTKKGDSYIV
jgi:predicted transcriptional regulator of viral defense system